MIGPPAALRLSPCLIWAAVTLALLSYKCCSAETSPGVVLGQTNEGILGNLAKKLSNAKNATLNSSNPAAELARSTPPAETPEIYAEQFGNVLDEFGNAVKDASAGGVDKIEDFDFDASSGLSFILEGGANFCFYEDIKSDMDGSEMFAMAYVVSSGNNQIDVEVKGPKGTLWTSYEKDEGFYKKEVKDLGTYEVCFKNDRYNDMKLITYVYETLKQNHPIKIANIQPIEQALFRVEAQLGVVESDQRLLGLQTEKQIAVQEIMNATVGWYTLLESAVYLAVVIGQIVYIRNMLDGSRVRSQGRGWA